MNPSWIVVIDLRRNAQSGDLTGIVLFTRAVDIVGGTLSGQADGNLGAVFGHGAEILVGQAARHDLHHRQLLLEDFARQIQKAHEIGNLFVADHGAKNGHIIFLHNKALRLFSVLTKWNWGIAAVRR